ncbi:MAG: class I SAM-dependent methyltransferase family protein [Sulfolobales archaeon]
MVEEVIRLAECVEVESVSAERAIALLRSHGLLLPSHLAKSDRLRKVVRVPVVDGTTLLASDVLREYGISSIPCVDVFKAGFRRVRFTDLLRSVLPDEVLRKVPRSYQLVGSIAIIHLPEDLLSYGSIVGEAIARVSPGVKAVYTSIATEGEFRVRRLARIWGEDVSETVHTEYGIKLCIDIKKVYFNPTLSYEHWRVSEEVRDGERVLDLFSGVGPYSLHIASKRNATCFAVDSNPWAIVYLVKSIRLNKLRGRVVPVLSRVEEFLELASEEAFSRVIIDLPHKSLEYLCDVLRILSCGGVGHVYAVSRDGPPELKPLKSAYITEVRKVLEYAPRKYIYGLKLVKTCGNTKKTPIPQS